MLGSLGVGDALIFQPRIELGETLYPRLGPEHLVAQIADLVLNLTLLPSRRGGAGHRFYQMVRAHLQKAESDIISLVDRSMNANSATKPRMISIKNLAKNGRSQTLLYNHRRPHQAMNNQFPMAAWRAGIGRIEAAKTVDMPLRLDNANALPTYPQQMQKQQQEAA